MPSSGGSLVEVEEVAAGGWGVARVGGKVVFLPFTAPGDRVRFRLQQDLARWSVGAVVEVVSQGPGRGQPVCPSFGVCGGCRLQHLSYATQLEVKRGWVQAAFGRIARAEVEVESVRPSPRWVGYRNKAGLHVGEGSLGFLEFHSTRVVDLPVCPLLEPPLQDVQRALRSCAPLVEGTKRRVVLRCGTHDPPLVVLHDAPDRGFVSEVASRVPGARVVGAGSREVVSFRCRGVVFRVEAESFFQVNTSQLEPMVDLLAEFLTGPGTLVDCHAGVGFPSLCLAPRFDRVVCVEIAGRSCERGRSNAAEAGLDHVTFFRGCVAGALRHGVVSKADALLLDPPRAGLMPHDLEAVRSIRAPRVAYVSCHPATQARDVRALLDLGYRVERVVPLDLFPHTAHVESVAFLSRGE